MAGLREQRGLQTTTSRDKDLPYLPQQPNYTYHPNAPPENYTALPQMRGEDGYVAPHGTAVPEYYPDYQHDSSTDYATANSSEYSNAPSGGVPEKKGGMRKLLKKRL